LLKRFPTDKSLGLNSPISRRDFLDGVLFASVGSLASAACPAMTAAQLSDSSVGQWAGYRGEGDYKDSAGNTEEVVHDAHAVRDGQYDREPVGVVETGEVYDCVIVGAGFAGLSAALFFQKRTGTRLKCLILDNARVFGGVAKRNEFIVDGHRLYAPQGSVDFERPYPHSFLESVYDAIGLDWEAFKHYQRW
jgi:spermidine dehydrogenase